MSMIQIDGLEKRYGKFQALHPLTLHIEKGEVFGFLGPNGAGKTTTIRTLAATFQNVGMHCLKSMD